MRHWIKTYEAQATDRIAVLVDSLGVLAIFGLFYAALHLPLLA